MNEQTHWLESARIQLLNLLTFGLIKFSISNSNCHTHISCACVCPSGELPTVQISGSNTGQPIIIGQDVELRCVPTGGVPFPTVAWSGVLPPGATQSQDGQAVVLRLSNVLQRTCISCIGTSLAGVGTDEECIEVTSK